MLLVFREYFYTTQTSDVAHSLVLVKDKFADKFDCNNSLLTCTNVHGPILFSFRFAAIHGIVILCDILQLNMVIDVNVINIHKKWHVNQRNIKKVTVICS